MMSTRRYSYLSSPLNLSLLLLLSTIAISTLAYAVLPELKYRVFSFIAVGCSSFLLGRIYRRYVNLTPSKIFKKVVALYYLLFSRVWILIISLIFINNYYDLIAINGIQNITMLVVFSLASLIATYYSVYFFFGLGARTNSRAKTEIPAPL